ncbi:hypothetical protein [Moorena bouillonii]|uniref:Glycosyltransferase RgtA/B/C/D-like domain-containing protein n=2 Tax=Moorena TaxID=1155738 RepID=A0A1U7N742_9CYAN|nr:hypothetical protein [Moorena bouillonii]OLT61724.1 hypothetical protein BJP37_24565 [Moorena bouillonii PNG]
MKNKLINYHISNICLLLLSLFCVALHSSFGRPIWIDEFLHFAFGSYETTAEAWNAISQSILTINHGQTGIYMLINYWLMQLFGANIFWLRFPSIFSGLVLFLAAIYLFRLWGMPFFWQVIGILALFDQTQLMYFVGEARPYMPLVTATVCTLAYYSTPLPQRTRPILTFFGLFSILMGVLFHPYFYVYWLAIIVFTYLQKLIKIGKKISINSVIKHTNIPLCVLGTIVYFTLGLLTWLRGQPEFTFDPFYWSKKDELITTFIGFSHFEFLQKFLEPLLITIFVIFSIIIVYPKLRKVYLKELISPIFLIIIALGISIFLSYVSFRSNYWILPRQWVASISLVPLAFVWLGYKISKIFAKIHIIIAFLWIMLCFTPIVLQFQKVAIDNYQDIRERLAQISVISKESQDSFEDLESIEYFERKSHEYWVSLANKNIQQGGKVWKGFRSFYSPPK